MLCDLIIQLCKCAMQLSSLCVEALELGELEIARLVGGEAQLEGYLLRQISCLLV